LQILHVDTGRGWRGGQQQVLWLLDGCRELGLAQMLLSPFGSPLAARTRQAGIEVIEISPQPLALENLRTVRRLARQFDIIHAHDSHAHSMICAALPFGGRSSPRLIVSRRVGFPIGTLGRAKYGFPAMFIAISEFARWRLMDAGVPAEKIQVVYDGVRAPVSLPPPAVRAEMRRRLGIGEESFVFGTLSSFAPEKQLGEELRLLTHLPDSAHFLLGVPAGESDSGEAGAALLDEARRIAAANRFHIVPVAEDPGAILSALDLFLYLSRMEGLGSAVLLAMAYALPVIASEVGGVPEIVRHQQTGLLVGEDYVNELAPVVRFLMGAPRLRAKLAHAAREFVCAHATNDKMVAQTVVVYRNLLQGGSEASA
jgi:glycosyltransferase involved in cell wall biosynthesis